MLRPFFDTLRLAKRSRFLEGNGILQGKREHLTPKIISVMMYNILHPRRNSMPNPFFFGPKITSSEHFIGRKKEIQKIFGYLNTEHTGQIQHVSVIGERRIGKSSLLYRLPQVTKSYIRNDENYRLLYIDLQHRHSLHSLLDHFLRKLNLSRPSNVSLERFYELIEREHEKKGRWNILLLDEFEKLTERPTEFTDEFYDTLRALGNNNLLGIVTASQHSLRDLAAQEKLTSPFFNIFHQIELGEFSAEEAQALLDRGRLSDQAFTDDDCQHIINIAGYHPARLQIVGRIVYETKESGAKLSWKDIEQEAKKEPAFDANLNHHKGNKLTEKIPSALHWIFISLPQIIGKAFLQFLGREHIADSTAWIWGALWLGVAIAFLFGVLPWTTITKYTRELLGLID